ncbi:MAG: hypothetical protein ACLTXM_15200 [Enterococcus sp.]
MEGTTKEQDKIRRVTLLISVLLLLSSVGSYLLYQQFYQPELQVTFVSKKVLPNTGTIKKNAQQPKKTQVNDKNTTQTTVSKDLIHDPLVQSSDKWNTRIAQMNSTGASPTIFKLSDKIGTFPIVNE